MVDDDYMRQALAEAEACVAHGDVPVGAVVVQEGRIIGRGRNRRVLDRDPLAHAELVAVRSAAAALDSWRLDACTLYVTLEPCVMCSGVLQQARVGSVVFGAADPSAGGVRSRYQLLEDPRLPFRIAVRGGVLAEECAALLRSFFRDRRR